MYQSLKKKSLVIAGTIFVGIGFVGIFVPILPTTPFLLLAAFCYIRSSDRFYNWLITNRLLGTYIRSYLERKGMPRKVKVATIALLWIGILCSIVFATDNLITRIILLVIAIGVTLHISLLKPTSRVDLHGK